jgi:hypothetical protein
MFSRFLLRNYRLYSSFIDSNCSVFLLGVGPDVVFQQDTGVLF